MADDAGNTIAVWHGARRKNARAAGADTGAVGKALNVDTVMEAKVASQDSGPCAAKLEPYGLNDLMSLSVSTGAISPAMARHMRDTMQFERQRPINAENVSRLAAEMKRGWFLAGTPIFICVLPGGEQVLINGNHTLEAIHNSGVTIPLTIIRKAVAGIEDAARCYATFDIQKIRTWNDTIQAVGFAENIPLLPHVVPAVGIIMGGFKYAHNSIDVKSRRMRIEVLPEYLRAASTVAEALGNCTQAGRRVVQRAAIMAVALYTAKYQPSTAMEFWGGVAKDDGLRKDDPRKALLKFAANNSVLKTGGSGGRDHQIKAAALAWNAWFEGRTLEVCKPGQFPVLKILGTPLHKGAAE